MIAVILFGAIALRAVAAKKEKRTFTVTIKNGCAKVKDGETVWTFHDHLKGADPECSLDDLTWCSETGTIRLRDLGEKKSKTPLIQGGGRPGTPHVQQTAIFTTPKGLQAFANELDPKARAREKAPPNSSPAPQVQQHVESTTPEAAKAISLALSR